ncbi:hypothetical protein [Stenotrophomonas sp. Ker107b]
MKSIVVTLAMSAALVSLAGCSHFDDGRHHGSQASERARAPERANVSERPRVSERARVGEEARDIRSRDDYRQ